jgi:Tol biopolymer transport system component
VYYNLYRARPDLRDRVKLATGQISSPCPSPDGAWLLYRERGVKSNAGAPSTNLVLYHVRNRKEVRRIPDTWDCLKPAAWMPDASTFSFQDRQGIHLESVDGSIRRVLEPGIQLAWSRSGRLIAYTSDRGWPQGNDLHVMDIQTNQQRVVASRRPGRFSGALFTPDETKILFVVEFVDGRGESQLHMTNLAGSTEAEIWRSPGSLLESEGLRWTKSSDRLLIATAQFPTPRATLHIVDLGGRARQLVEHRTYRPFSWDYYPDTDALIVPTEDRAGFMVIVVGQAVGSHSLRPTPEVGMSPVSLALDRH